MEYRPYNAPLSTTDIIIEHYTTRLARYESLADRNAAVIGMLEAIQADRDVNYILQHTHAVLAANANLRPAMNGPRTERPYIYTETEKQS